MSNAPIDQPLSADSLRSLRDQNLISPEVYWKGVREIETGRGWLQWASIFFLILGAALVLSGVVFFFAYNWADMHRFAKFGVLQGSVLAALLGTQFIGLDRLSGKLCLLSASMLIGVCFAVYGQVYQTGADAFGYFMMWAICIFPWVFVGRFAPLWVLWLVLVNLTVWFFWQQVGRFHETLDFPYLMLVLSSVNGAAFQLRHSLSEKYEWLNPKWLSSLLLIALVVPLTAPVFDWIVEFSRSDGISYLLAAMVWGAVVSWLFVFYNFKSFDAAALSLVLADVAFILLCLIGRGLDEADVDWTGFFFLMAVLTIGLSAGLLVYIRKRIEIHDNSGKELNEIT